MREEEEVGWMDGLSGGFEGRRMSYSKGLIPPPLPFGAPSEDIRPEENYGGVI